MPAHYDDPNYSYPSYWLDRDYEHGSEAIALHRLLATRQFTSAADIGGGYGRLVPVLTRFAQKISLIEPSIKQRQLAKKLVPTFPKLSILPGTAQKTSLRPNTFDLVTLIRVMHHLPDPQPALVEIHRLLKPGGVLVLEFANSSHFKARLKSYLSGRPISIYPLERRSQDNIARHTIDFVNHHPQAVAELLTRTGFSVQNRLSVSNFRSELLKKIFPISWLLALENITQAPLSYINFGPSIFIYAIKK